MLSQALKRKLTMLVAAVNKRNIMKVMQLGKYQGEVSTSLRRFVQYLHNMSHVCFNKSIADPVQAAKEIKAAVAKAAAKSAAAAKAAAKDDGGELALVVEDAAAEVDEPRYTVQEVLGMYDRLPHSETNVKLLRMAVWVTDEDASDYLAVFASPDSKRSELLGMGPNKGSSTKYGVVMHGAHAMPSCLS